MSFPQADVDRAVGDAARARRRLMDAEQAEAERKLVAEVNRRAEVLHAAETDRIKAMQQTIDEQAAELTLLRSLLMSIELLAGQRKAPQ